PRNACAACFIQRQRSEVHVNVQKHQNALQFRSSRHPGRSGGSFVTVRAQDQRLCQAVQGQRSPIPRGRRRHHGDREPPPPFLGDDRASQEPRRGSRKGKDACGGALRPLTFTSSCLFVLCALARARGLHLGHSNRRTCRTGIVSAIVEAGIASNPSRALRLAFSSASRLNNTRKPKSPRKRIIHSSSTQAPPPLAQERIVSNVTPDRNPAIFAHRGCAPATRPWRTA